MESTYFGECYLLHTAESDGDPSLDVVILYRTSSQLLHTHARTST